MKKFAIAFLLGAGAYFVLSTLLKAWGWWPTFEEKT